MNTSFTLQKTYLNVTNAVKDSSASEKAFEEDSSKLTTDKILTQQEAGATCQDVMPPDMQIDEQQQRAALVLQHAMRIRGFIDSSLEKQIAIDLGKLLGYEKETMGNAIKELLKSLSANGFDEIKFLQLLKNKTLKFKNNPDLHILASIMQLKSKGLSCEATLKIFLYIKNAEDVIYIKQMLTNSAEKICEKMKERTPAPIRKEIEKILGYILNLNLNKKTYVEIIIEGALQKKIMLGKFLECDDTYFKFVEINRLAAENPNFSEMRRSILFKSELLENRLQRDPEEAYVYDQQMGSEEARKDKMQLLTELEEAVKNNHSISVIDIGPAGGATFNSVIKSCSSSENNGVRYVGIEFDANELRKLNEMLTSIDIDGKKADEIIKSGAIFIEGNALELKKVIDKIHEKKIIQDEPLTIVLSSVIHEIYSYGSYNSKQKYCDDIVTMTGANASQQYNPETVYKIYEEALLALKKNGGTLNVRDGVMYDNSEEIVSFTLKDVVWRKMFKMFIDNSKYKKLNDTLPSEININHPEAVIQLPAKYVQEFMLKANWGPESFGNEINEVYCYMRLTDHLKLINRAAKENDMAITIKTAKAYTQEGYKEHITSNQIEIKEGFGIDKFPPTNLIIKINVEKTGSVAIRKY